MGSARGTFTPCSDAIVFVLHLRPGPKTFINLSFYDCPSCYGAVLCGPNSVDPGVVINLLLLLLGESF